MRKSVAVICIILFTLALPAAEHKWGPLPLAVSDNAVVSLKVNKHLLLVSLMGMSEKKTWDAITNRVFALDAETGKWTELRPVPGPAGRLGAAAARVRDAVYLMGGYTIDGMGDRTPVRSMEVYIPGRETWFRGDDLPMPLHDFVLGVYRDRYIYTVSGQSKNESVKNVQVYDTEKSRWQQATPIPGTAVFGHAGALLDDTIVYVDGAYRSPSGDKPPYVASDECWMGKIDHHDVTKIQWTKLPQHPGTARFGIAAGASEQDQKIYFSGGTENPYNYDGIGYDGRPAEPVAMTFAWNQRTGKWQVISENTPEPTMGNRAMLVAPQGMVRLGGMEKGQKVTSVVTVLPRK